MIGETTLAMLYVPLLFYLFDRLAEGKDEAADAQPRRRAGSRAAMPRRVTADAPARADGTAH